MTRFYFFILTILFFSVNNTDARQLIYESGGELTPDLASFDVTHYDLNVKINPADSTVAGYVDIYFNMVQPNNQIALALDPGMDLDSVEWLDSSSEVSFNRVEDHRTFYVRSEERRVGKECRCRWWRYV